MRTRQVDACIDAASSFATDYWLQTQLLQSGVLWTMLPHLFNYDYTLEVGQLSVDSLNRWGVVIF